MKRLEYPRPQRKRSLWQPLNGTWDFAFDIQASDYQKDKAISLQFNKKIEVPFSYQSSASGVGDSTFHEYLFYRREFDLSPELQKHNVLLNFGAVDNECDVFLNDVFLGHHRGGYTSFHFEVTPLLKEKGNVLLVFVRDSASASQIRGKQWFKKEPYGCWYSPDSGIWQSVWLEGYQDDYYSQILLTPDCGSNAVGFSLNLDHEEADLTGEIQISYQGKPVKYACVSLEKTTQFSLSLMEENPIDDLHFWSPEHPSLYEVVILLKKEEKILDRIETYFAFRSIEVDEFGHVCLNHQRLYQRLVLDQGYFKEGDLTALNVSDFEKDIRYAKAMGFNGCRMHQKIEDPYFYYTADRMGFLVWAEIPSAYQFGPEEIENYASEIPAMIAQLYPFPSIIAYVPFNESWGVRDLLFEPKQQAFVSSVVDLIRSLDQTRLVESNDGWEVLNDGDFVALHDYDSTGAFFAEKYGFDHLDESQAMFRRSFAQGARRHGRPVILSEYGGFSTPSDQGKDFYGYTVKADKEAIYSALETLQKNIHLAPFEGFCYTQLTDVRQERNGLLDESHNPKYDLARIRRIIAHED